MKKILLILLVLFLFPLTVDAQLYRSDKCKVEFNIPDAWGSAPSNIEIDPKIQNAELLSFSNVDYGLVVTVGKDKDLQGNSFAQIANNEHKNIFLNEMKKMREKANKGTTVESISFKKIGVYDAVYYKMSALEEGKTYKMLEVNILQDGVMYILSLRAVAFDSQAEAQFESLVGSVKNI